MISTAVILSALELGFIYALVALALFLSFRVLNIADMTTDGSFVLGGAVSAVIAVMGHPFLALPLAMLAGAAAGCVTAFLQTKLKVPSILAGIITNTGLYTVNLAVMGFSSNVTMLKTATIFTIAKDSLGPVYKLVPAAAFALLVGVLIALTALIPIVGAFIGCGVGALLIAINDPWKALLFIVVFLVLQQIEGNFIYPHVVGNSVGLPSIWVLAAVMLGGKLMGVVGMLIFIPLCSVAYALFRSYVKQRLKERSVPSAKWEDTPQHKK